MGLRMGDFQFDPSMWVRRSSPSGQAGIAPRKTRTKLAVKRPSLKDRWAQGYKKVSHKGHRENTEYISICIYTYVVFQ